MTDIVQHAQTELAEQMDYARAVCVAPERGAQSLLPEAYRGNPANVLIAVGLGRAIGLSPSQSLYEIYVVNGRPSPSANLMAALARRAGHKLRIRGDAQSCTATLIRADDPDEPFEATWTFQQAKDAGLTGKATWKAYPAAMLRSRAISEVVRMGASECVMGMDYSADEMRDLEQTAPAAAPKTATDRLRAAIAPPAPPVDEPIEADVVTGEVLEPKLSDQHRAKMFATLTRKGCPEDRQAEFIEQTIGRHIEHRDAITVEEYDSVIARLATLDDKVEEQS